MACAAFPVIVAWASRCHFRQRDAQEPLVVVRYVPTSWRIAIHSWSIWSASIKRLRGGWGGAQGEHITTATTLWWHKQEWSQRCEDKITTLWLIVTALWWRCYKIVTLWCYKISYPPIIALHIGFFKSSKFMTTLPRSSRLASVFHKVLKGLFFSC